MSRDTSTRSSGDREDTSLSIGSLLWAAEFFLRSLFCLLAVVVAVVLLGEVSSSLMVISVVFVAASFACDLVALLRAGLDDDGCKHLDTPQRSKLHTASEDVSMSRTVSFRASEKLDEFLEQEAERRLVTKSTVAQMLIAERYRQIQDDQQDPPQVPEVNETEAEDNDSSGGDSKEERPEFDRYPDKWYRPDSGKGYEYAVRLAAGGRRKYYKTADGAADRLKKEYGE